MAPALGADTGSAVALQPLAAESGSEPLRQRNVGASSRGRAPTSAARSTSRDLEPITDGLEVAAPLLLGTFGSTAATLLPPVVAAAQRRYPHLGLSSRELDVDEVVTAVQHGRVDVAFGLDYPNTPMPRTSDIEMITLRTERFGLAVSSGAYGIRTEFTIELRQTADWNWIMPPADTQFGQAVRTACRQEGFEPIVRHEIIDTAVSLALAGKGLGATFVTDMMVGLNPSVPIIRIALTQDVTRRIVLIHLAGADVRPTVRAITEIVRDVVDPAGNEATPT